MDISSSSIIANDASVDGGGIYNTGQLDIHQSVITGNTATNTDGGGISNGGDEMTITNSTISNNAADQFAGGINNHGGVVDIRQSTFMSNAGYHGGGLANRLACEATKTVAAAAAVVPGGSVLGLDISEPLLARAREVSQGNDAVAYRLDDAHPSGLR